MAGNGSAAQVRIAAAGPGQRAHDLRIGPQPGYVISGSSDLNRVLMEPLRRVELRTICLERRARRPSEKAMRSNATVEVAGIITFGKRAQVLFEALDADAQDAAYREVAEAVAKRLDTSLSGLVVHRDESAPHAHFQLPGVTHRGYPVSRVAKIGALRDLQTIAAQVMARHAPGIERGTAKTLRLAKGEKYADVVHRSVKQLHADLPAEIAAAKAEAATRIAALATEIAAAEDKARVNEDRAEKARLKARGEGDKARKAARNAEAYERRAGDAKAELERLTAELEALRGREEALVGREVAAATREAQLASERDEAEVHAWELVVRQEALAAQEAEARHRTADEARIRKEERCAEAERVALERDAEVAVLTAQAWEERGSLYVAMEDRDRAEAALFGKARIDDQLLAFGAPPRCDETAQDAREKAEWHDDASALWREGGLETWKEVLAQAAEGLSEEMEDDLDPWFEAALPSDRLNDPRNLLAVADEALGSDHADVRSAHGRWVAFLVGLRDWQSRTITDLRAHITKLRVETFRVWAEARALWAKAAERIRETLAARERALDARGTALAAGEAALAEREAKAAITDTWVARGVGNLRVALDRAVAGTHEDEVHHEDMAAEPAKFAALKAAAPGGRPTLGFRARFWSLSFGDGTGPAPLPPKVRDAIAPAFDRVAAWAGEVAATRADLRRQSETLAESKMAVEALRVEAKAQVDHQISEAQARFEALVTREPQVRQWTSYADLFVSKTRQVLHPDDHARLCDAVAAEWRTHPDNLMRAAFPTPPSNAGPSGL